MTSTTAVQAAYEAVAEPCAPPKTRDEVILAELPQVYYVAARIQERLPKSVQLEDLVNAGVVGLIEAYNSFDHAKNTQFRTFAKFRIRGAILDSLRELDWGSRSLRRRGREISEASAQLEAALGRAPTQEEIAGKLGLTPEQLEVSLIQLDSVQIVGQQVVSSFEGGDMLDLIESAPSNAENAFDLFAKAERKTHLARAIGSLSEREQLILSLYYKEGLTMKQVAGVVGIAVSRVSQIHNVTILKLRNQLAHQGQRGANERTASGEGAQ